MCGRKSASGSEPVIGPRLAPEEKQLFSVSITAVKIINENEEI